MWTSGTILQETAIAWGFPAILTWGKLNLRIMKYLQKTLVCAVLYIQAHYALCSSHQVWGKESEPHMS